MDTARRAIGVSTDAMTEDEIEATIAAFHAHERELLVAGDGEAALEMACTKFVLLSALEGRRGRR